jgi:hypothetical protein
MLPFHWPHFTLITQLLLSLHNRDAVRRIDFVAYLGRRLDRGESLPLLGMPETSVVSLCPYIEANRM